MTMENGDATSVEVHSAPDAEPDQSAYAKLAAKLKHLTPLRMLMALELDNAQTLQQMQDHSGIPVATLKTNLGLMNQKFNGELFTHSRLHGYKLTERGRHITEVFRQILDMQEALVTQREGLVVRYFPHHSTTVLPAAAALRPRHTVELSVLGEHHRSIGHFISRALRPLVAGTYDVVMGIDLPDMSEVADIQDKLEQQILYHAWLEVMVPAKANEDLDPADFVEHGPDGDYVDLTKLLDSKAPILTAPTDTRSRTYLDRAVDPTRKIEPAMAEFESKVLVMGAHAGLGLPVLPSDVALQFDYRVASNRGDVYRGPLAGEDAPRWHWLPLINADGNRISYNVVAHYRNEHHADAKTDLFLNALADNVRTVMTRAHRSEALQYNEK